MPFPLSGRAARPIFAINAGGTRARAECLCDRRCVLRRVRRRRKPSPDFRHPANPAGPSRSARAARVDRRRRGTGTRRFDSGRDRLHRRVVQRAVRGRRQRVARCDQRRGFEVHGLGRRLQRPGSCTVTVSADMHVFAHFDPITVTPPPQITLSVAVSGPGQVTGGGLTCGAGATTCSVTLPPGTAVTLTATASASARFVAWEAPAAAAPAPASSRRKRTLR